MKRNHLGWLASLLLVLLGMLPTPVKAQVSYNQTVTYIVGTGASDVGFVKSIDNNTMWSFRGRLRSGPVNVVGDTYTVPVGYILPAHTRALWNFDFQFEVDLDQTSGLHLSDYTYRLTVDKDPSPVINNIVIDMLASYPDMAVGDHSTPNSGGLVGLLLNGHTKMGNSEQIIFAPISGDADVLGTYSFKFEALLGGVPINTAEMTVNVVPEAETYVAGFSMVMLVGYGFYRRHNRK